MAHPLLLLGKALLGSELQSRAAPYMPTGIQQLLPSQSLAQNLAGIPSFLGYMTGTKQEMPSGNLPYDYSVTPTGLMASSGNYVPPNSPLLAERDQYMMDVPGGGGFMEPSQIDFTGGGAQGPGGGFDPFQITQVPSTEYESWWNPIDVMDLMENLPAAVPEEEETLYDSGTPMGYAPPKPIVQMTQPNVMR